MLSHTIVAFDIETIPDPDVGRRILGFEGDDLTVVQKMFAQRLEDTEGATGYPQSPHHRVVTIAAAGISPRSGHFKFATLGGDAMDERSHLEGFFRMIREATERPPSSPPATAFPSLRMRASRVPTSTATATPTTFRSSSMTR